MLPAESPEAAVIRADKLSYTYPTRRNSTSEPAINDVSLVVRQGEWLALTGPNGSGKSTLLRMLAGLIKPSVGELEVLSERGFQQHTRAKLGVLMQFTSLDPLLTVSENLLLHASLTGASHDAVTSWSDRFGLRDRMDDRASTLSGGLARRVDLARSLLHEPDLLLLDEPTASLDEASRDAFLSDLARLKAETNLTVVMTTHHADEVALADREIQLRAGQVVNDNGSTHMSDRAAI